MRTPPMAGGHGHGDVGSDIAKGMTIDQIAHQDLQRIRGQSSAADQGTHIIERTLHDAHCPGPVHGRLLGCRNGGAQEFDAGDILAIRVVRFGCGVVPTSVMPQRVERTQPRQIHEVVAELAPLTRLRLGQHIGLAEEIDQHLLHDVVDPLGTFTDQARVQIRTNRVSIDADQRADLMWLPGKRGNQTPAGIWKGVHGGSVSVYFPVPVSPAT